MTSTCNVGLTLRRKGKTLRCVGDVFKHMAQVAIFYIRNVRQTIHTMDIFRAIDGCALSVDSAAPSNDRSFAQSSTDRAPGSVDCGANKFALTTDSCL